MVPGRFEVPVQTQEHLYNQVPPPEVEEVP